MSYLRHAARPEDTTSKPWDHSHDPLNPTDESLAFAENFAFLAFGFDTGASTVHEVIDNVGAHTVVGAHYCKAPGRKSSGGSDESFGYATLLADGVVARISYPSGTVSHNTFQAPPWDYMDVLDDGAVGNRAEWEANLVGQLTQQLARVDLPGIYVDNGGEELYDSFATPGKPHGYTVNGWSAAIRAILAAVVAGHPGKVLASNGYLSDASTSGHRGLAQLAISGVEYLLFEGWAFKTSGTFRSVTEYQQNLDDAIAALATGKKAIVCDYFPQGDTRVRIFRLASYLLAMNTGTPRLLEYAVVSDSGVACDRCIEYNAPIDALGAPTGDYTKSGNLFTREFANGVVYLNGDPSTSLDVTLPGGCSKLGIVGGTAYNDANADVTWTAVGGTVSLGPGSALVLQRSSGGGGGGGGGGTTRSAHAGSGWAALFTTTEGTRYAITSRLRAFSATVPGVGLVYFRPSAMSAPIINGGIQMPFSRVNVYGDCTFDAANTDWWIAEHLDADSFASAEVTCWLEEEGALSSVLFSGYVKQKAGVQADGTRASFSCVDTLGFFLPGKQIGGKTTLERETFPNLAPPPLVSVTMNPFGSSGDGSDAITSVVVHVNTSPAFNLVVPYAGPWPAGPVTITGIPNGVNKTLTVTGLNADPAVIFAGTATITISGGRPILLWVTPSDVDVSDAPATIANPDEGKPIPAIIGQYLGANAASSQNDINAQYFVPSMVYDWAQADGNLYGYVVEDLKDSQGAPMKSRTAGNGDVILIDTQPPQSDADGNPIPFAYQYIDDATSVRDGKFVYLRKDGIDVVPPGSNPLLRFPTPSGGFPYVSFKLNAAKFNAWWKFLKGVDPTEANPAYEFSPLRFHILLQAGGGKCNDPIVAPILTNNYRIADAMARVLVEDCDVPSDRIDLAALQTINDTVNVRWHRYFTQGEDAETVFAAICQEARVLCFTTAAGLISWKKTSLTAPPPAVFRFDEVRCVAGSMSVTTNDWGPHFNTCSGQTEQGLPYQVDVGKVTVGERKNQAAIDADDGKKILPPDGPILFKGLYDPDEMKACLDEYLSVQGLPSNTYSATVSGLNPVDGSPDARDYHSQLAVVGGDTIEPSYIASRVDAAVRRLLPKGSKAIVLGFSHDPENRKSTFTFWKFGSSATGQSQMLLYDGNAHFPSSLGGGAIGSTWNTGWSDAQKAYAANFGSGVGGWISEEGSDKIDSGDSSAYAYSPMRSG